jgi:2-hydroxychromene-2-carboxylate isomerase
VALDVRHPFAYLALGPALALGRELAIDVELLPFEGRTLRPPSAPAPDDDRGVRHRRHRAHAIAREIAVYAQARGLTLQEPYREGPSRAARLAWLFVRGRARPALPAFLAELFRRYWSLELDAGALCDAARLVGDHGLPARAFERWAAERGEEELGRVDEALRTAGVDQTPAYLVEDELFYGRQHLPMIRWILGGRTGPGPA